MAAPPARRAPGWTALRCALVVALYIVLDSGSVAGVGVDRALRAPLVAARSGANGTRSAAGALRARRLLQDTLTVSSQLGRAAGGGRNVARVLT